MAIIAFETARMDLGVMLNQINSKKLQMEKDVFPLHPSQQELYLDQLINPNSPRYNIGGYLKLKGKLDVSMLGQALKSCIRALDVFSVTFDPTRSVDSCYLQNNGFSEMCELDLSQDPFPESSAIDWMKKQFNIPFVISKENELFQHVLIKIADDEYWLFHKYHHLITDGYGFTVWLRCLANKYKALTENEEVEEIYGSYFAEAVLAKQDGSSINYQVDAEYWKEKITNTQPKILQKKFYHIDAAKTKVYSIELNQHQENVLKNLKQLTTCSLQQLTIAALIIYFGRLTEIKEFLFGVFFHKRIARRLRNIVGTFSGILPFRGSFKEDYKLSEFLKDIRSAQLNDYRHKDVSIGDLSRHCKIDPAKEGLFEIIINYELFDFCLDFGEHIHTATTQLINDHEIHPLEICWREFGTQQPLQLCLQYREEYFDSIEINLLAKRILNILEQFSSSMNNPIESLTILPSEERCLLDSFNDTSTECTNEKTILHLFEDQVLKTPSKIAIVFENETLTYRELNERSNQLASFLRKMGIKGEDLVPICLDRGSEMMIGIFGILKAGAAYVPIDRACPAERMRFIVEQTGARMLVTNNYSQLGLEFPLLKVIDLTEDLPLICSEPVLNIFSYANPSNLVYVMFTSGSTGKPKGVLVEHRGLVNTLMSIANEIAIDESCIFLGLTTFAFDMCCVELFMPLLNGGRVVIIKKRTALDGFELIDSIDNYHPTHIQATPATWQLLKTCKWQPKHPITMLTGADFMHNELKEWLTCKGILYNLYGPTEATIWSTIMKLNESAEVLIGHPMMNVQVYITNDKLERLPIGVVGELCIGGHGVARGYLGMTGHTAEKFVANPFSATDCARLYKSGDLGCWLPDGNIMLFGRRDNQVKIRGHRVELGEIETVILQSEMVKQVVVLVTEDVLNNKRLVAYIIPTGNYTRESLGAYLKNRLHNYMIPEVWVQMKTFPVNINGKIDKKNFPSPDVNNHNSLEQFEPRNETEKTLRNIWQKLLGISAININDNFFDLGGNSLLAMKIISDIHESFHVQVPVKELFVSPTIAQLSAYIQDIATTDHNQIAKTRPRPGHVPLSISQERLWFIHKLQGSVQYHIPVRLRLLGILNISALDNALREIIARHEILRSVIKEEDGQASQLVRDADRWQLQIITSQDHMSSSEDLEQRVQSLIESPFDLSEDYMLRGSLFNLEKEEHLLVLVVHHIAADGWSLAIMLKELVEFYNAWLEMRQPAVKALPLQYADYVLWQRLRSEDAEITSHLNYWENKLKDITVLNLPTDFVRPQIQSTRGNVVRLSIKDEIVRSLKKISAKNGATLFMTVLSVFKILLFRNSGQTDVCVGTSFAGRLYKETEDLIGFFVSTLVLRTIFQPDFSFLQLLTEVKATILEASDHQVVSVEQLIEIAGKDRTTSQSSLFQVAVIMQNIPETMEVELLHGLKIVREKNSVNTSKFDITFYISEAANSLECSIEYCSDLFSKKTIEQMMNHFENLLQSVINDPNEKICKLAMQTPEEINQLLHGFNNTAISYATNKTIIDLFIDQVCKTPDSIAVVCENDLLTYKQLNQKTNVLTSFLLANGVEAGRYIPIIMNDGIAYLITIIAVLKSGCSFVPLAPEWPVERLCAIIKEIEPNLVLVDKENVVIESALKDICNFKAISYKELGEDDLNINKSQPGALICMLYTSGSSGQPKGVELFQKGIANRLFWMNDYFGDSSKSVLKTTKNTFDASLWQLLWPLINGGKVIIPVGDIYADMDYLVSLISQYEIRIIDFVPSVFRIFVNHVLENGNAKLDNLQDIILGGEALIANDIKMFASEYHAIRISNLYGPTEASIGCVCHSVNKGDTNLIPIGRPISNMKIYILGPNGQVCPVGVAGEICISGIGLARGYFNNAKLTAVKFIKSPFDEDSTLYTTGDLGKWTDSGDIIFLGRLDEQVKIRGCRVEPEEVKHAIERSKYVKQAFVLAKDDDNGDKQLVAYVVSGQGYSKESLLNGLKQHLPDYMIPAALVEIEEMPIAASGKVDRAKLSNIKVEMEAGIAHVEPQSPIEERMAMIWKRFLRVEKIGVTDNFFELGGHSLLILRIIAAVRKDLLVELSVKDFFIHPCISELVKSFPQSPEASPIKQFYTGEKTDHIPLSFGQRRLLFIDKLFGSIAYHIPIVLKLRGNLNKDALTRALKTIVERHEPLRTVIKEADGEFFQQVLDADKFCLSEVDASQYSNNEKELNSLVRELIEQSFNLFSDLMLRVVLVTLNTDQFLLVATMHHISADIWSLSIMSKELVELYNAYVDERPYLLDPIQVKYSDYSLWQRNYLEDSAAIVKMDYWKKKLSGATQLMLPFDHQLQPVIPDRGARVYFTIEDATRQQLKKVGQQNDVTLFITMLSAYSVLLYKYCNQHDICVGTSISERPHQELEGLIGFFLSLLVIRSELHSGLLFTDLLKQIKQAVLEAHENMEIPFEKIVEITIGNRNIARNPLFQTAFILINTPEIEQPELKGLKVSNERHEIHTSKFELMMSVLEAPGGIEGYIEYRTGLFEKETIDQMIACYKRLIAEIIIQPSQEIGMIDIVSDEEKYIIEKKFNSAGIPYDSKETIIGLFDRQVLTNPGKIALIFENREITYRELDRLSDKIADCLFDFGVKPETLVPVIAEKNANLIIALLGILKAGAAYVPVDSAYPMNRKEFIISDCSASVVLEASTDNFFEPQHELAVLKLSDIDFYDGQPVIDRTCNISHTNLACIMYTSGSTGKPKGVMIEHRNIVSLVKGLTTIKVTENDSVLSTGSPAFDAITFEYWCTLLTGGTLVLSDTKKELDLKYLKDLITSRGVTKMWFTSGWFNQIVDADITFFEQLQAIIVGGEVLSPLHVKMVHKQYPLLNIVNGYGPTENTTFSLTYLTNHNNIVDSIPIGHPLVYRRAYVVCGEQLAPVGAIGEICLGGVGLSRGYLNNPGLTAAQFSSFNFFGYEERLYRTGDLGKWKPDGSIEFFGRVDDQVKIRGFRIEPREVETILMESGYVKQASVMVISHSDDHKKLVACIIPRDSFQESLLKDFLRLKLPDYMLPSLIVQMEALPLTVNNKVDKEALIKKIMEVQNELNSSDFETATENSLASLWKELLEINDIGRHDNFFDKGGHSLLAIRLISALRNAFHAEISIGDIFNFPILKALAAKIDDSKTVSDFFEIKRAQRPARIPLAYSQQRLWFVHKLHGSIQYHVSSVTRLVGQIHDEILEDAFREVISRHEILRTVIREENNLPSQLVNSEQQWRMQVEKNIIGCNGETSIHAFIEQITETPFDLASEYMLRAGLIGLHDEEHLLVITMHHIVSDAWSLSILVKEVTELYNSRVEKREPSLPDLLIQYTDYSIWQHRYLKSDLLAKQLAFWTKELKDLPPLNFPTDFQRPPLQSTKGDTFKFVFSSELTSALKQMCRQYNVTLFTLLLTAFDTLLYRYCGQEDISVGTAVAGRRQKETENLIGFFINPVVIRNKLDGNLSFEELLATVNQTVMAALENQDVPFEKVVDAVTPERDLSRSPLFQVALVLLNTPEIPSAKLTGLQLIPYELHHKTSQLDLNVLIRETNSQLACTIEYCTDLFKKATIQRLSIHFQNLLASAAEHPQQLLHLLPILENSERQKLLYGFNSQVKHYQKDKTFVTLFEAQVIETPELTAVEFELEKISYEELNVRANALAGYLQQNGVKRGMLVPICMERSIKMMIGIIAILKCGAAYVPIESSYPDERKLYIIKDTQAQLVICDTHNCSLFREMGLIVVDSPKFPETDSYKSTTSHEVPSPEDLAYVIYTSGSTGRPKGVMIKHKGLTNMIMCICELHELTTHIKVLQFASISSDASCSEIFPTLIKGRTLVLCKKESLLSLEQFTVLLQNKKIDLAVLPPSYQSQMKEALPFLKMLVSAGEPLIASIASFVQSHGVKLVNAYGPTENSVCATATKDPLNGGITIGEPIANVKIYILDRKNNLLPLGAIGEICIGGIQVASGYLNNHALTNEKFVTDTFSEDVNAKLYKTGDLGRWLIDGRIEYFGRQDDQVKINGFRVELGEIEKNILQIPAINQAAVMVYDDEGIGRFCACFIAEKKIDIKQMKASLKEKLPDYMVPSICTQLESLPLTTSGKVDKKILAGMALWKKAIYDENGSPRNEIEKNIAAIWEDRLQVENVGINDNFFDLGGDSIKIIGVVSNIQKLYGQKITLADVYESETLAQLAAHIQENVELEETNDIAVAVMREMELMKQSIFSNTSWFDEVEDIYPMSDIQKGMVYTSMIYPDRSIYHDQMVYHLPHFWDIDVFKQSICLLALKHAILRTAFDFDQDKEGIQLIYKNIQTDIDYFDYKSLTHAEAVETINQYIVSERHKHFNVQNAPLWRCTLFGLSDDLIFLFQCHHAILDGWSVATFNTELYSLYHKLVAKEVNGITDQLACSYKDFVIKNKVDNRNNASKNFWINELKDYKRLDLFLPDWEFQKVTKFFNSEYLEMLKNSVSKNRISLKSLFLGAYLFLLNTLTSENELTIGLLTNNRPTIPDGDKILGCFLNTVPFRFRFDKERLTWKQFFESIESKLNELKRYDSMSLVEITKINEEKNLDRNPFFDVFFDFTNFHIYDKLNKGLVQSNQSEDAPGNLQIEGYGETHTLFDCLVDTTGDTIKVRFTIKKKLKCGKKIEDLVDYFVRIIDCYLNHYNEEVDVTNIVSPDEYMLLSNFEEQVTSFPEEKNIIDLFEEQVNLWPESIAVTFKNKHVTYQDLNEKSTNFACYLRNKGVRNETLVPVCLERSLDMIVAILGIIKAGAAYVPIDPDYPQQRMDYILEDTKAAIVVSNKAIWPEPQKRYDIEMLEVVDEMPGPDERSLGELPAIIPTQMAYVIYTSGSTGNPKGVMIGHRQLVRLFKTGRPIFNFNENDVWCMFHSFCFDFSVWELFGALLNGGRLVIVERRLTKDAAQFAKFLFDERVTVLNQTPSFFYVLKDYIISMSDKISLRYVIFGGEMLNPAKLKTWKQLFNDCKLVNMYGITETTVHVTYKELDMSDIEKGISIIGKPIPTTSVYIFDNKAAYVSIGVPGELFIGGEGLASGYLNMPELTADKFQFHPRLRQTLYKTGDLGRWLPDGNIEYLGRNDDQVKIRGFRIELQEIEHVLEQSPLVERAFVIARDDNDHNKHLVAYILPTSRYFEKRTLMQHVSERLPEYMMPSLWVKLDELQLNSNGKVNKHALPAITSVSPERSNIPDAENEVQATLVKIWEDVLDVKDIAINDNFFDLGGDSIKILRMISIVNKTFNKSIEVKTVFSHPEISSLAAEIELRDSSRENDEIIKDANEQIMVFENSIVNNKQLYQKLPRQWEYILPLSEIQKGMLYYYYERPDSTVYHDQFYTQINGIALDIEVFKKSFSILTEKHAILRTSFHFDLFSAPVQIVQKQTSAQIYYNDISAESGKRQKEIMLQCQFVDGQKRFVLTDAGLWRIYLFKLNETEYGILWVFHHAIMDGWSLASLQTELSNLYFKVRENSDYKPPNLQASYRDYLVDQLIANQNLSINEFWASYLKNCSQTSLPFNRFVNYPNSQAKYCSRSFIVAEGIPEMLQKLSAELQISVKEIYLASFIYLLSVVNSARKITIGLVTHGRPAIEDGDKVLGCFLNTIPFVFTLEEDVTLEQLLLDVSRMHRKLRYYDRLPFTKIVGKMERQNGMMNPIFDIVFNYVNFHISSERHEGIFVSENNESSLKIVANTNTYFDLTVSNLKDRHVILVNYLEELYTGEEIIRLVDYYKNILKCITEEDFYQI